MSLLRAKRRNYNYIMLDYLHSIEVVAKFYLRITVDVSPERMAEGIYCYCPTGKCYIFQ